MTTMVKVNVSVKDVKKKGDDYEGKFHFQQVDPLDKIYVKKNGKIEAFKAPDDLDIEFSWVSDAVEIKDRLYEAYFRTPHCDSIWILPGENSDPGPGDKAPSSGNHDIIVPDGNDKRRLKLKDGNALDKTYKYAMAVHVEIEGGALLIKDPKIINKSINPRMAPGHGHHGSKSGMPHGSDDGDCD